MGCSFKPVPIIIVLRWCCAGQTRDTRHCEAVREETALVRKEMIRAGNACITVLYGLGSG